MINEAGVWLKCDWCGKKGLAFSMRYWNGHFYHRKCEKEKLSS